MHFRKIFMTFKLSLAFHGKRFQCEPILSNILPESPAVAMGLLCCKMRSLGLEDVPRLAIDRDITVSLASESKRHGHFAHSANSAQ